MTKTRTIINLFFYLAFISLGIFLSLSVYWTNSYLKIFEIVGWALIIYGASKFSSSVTTLFFKEEKVDLRNLLDFKYFKKIFGLKAAISIYLLYYFILALSICASFYLVISLTDKYEYLQLAKYGDKQKVLIKSVRRSRTGSYAYFDFYFNGKTYSEKLPVRNYMERDTATIIFSTHNPDINCWADEFYSK